MRRSIAWRALLSLSMAGSLAAYAQVGAASTNAAGGGLTAHVPQGGLSAADVQRLSQNANQHVIVILRDQHSNMPARGATSANRRAAIQSDQSGVVGELAQLHAPGVRAYHVINAVAATVSSAEVAHLQANPGVQAVVPDRIIYAPALPREQRTASAGAAAVQASNDVSPTSCISSPVLQPEALQLTADANMNPAVPTAQQIVTGTGVTVAFIADGIDPNNPDFIRKDGTHVFTDYQDFSGDGPITTTAGGEAFGDASSIAAQGNVTFDLRNYVDPSHSVPGCPYIKIVGMAPGASLMGLKVFGQNNATTTSNFVQAVQYAVDHGANVINESFGGNPYPDNANDPISLANDTAVAAGVTVVASSGDAGTAGTLGSPATDPNIIAAGASTQFQAYQQNTFAGYQLGGGHGYISDNISSLSSGGVAQSGKQAVDVVAPGDLSWADCSDSGLYLDCTNDDGQPSNLESFGGTSEASPLTAGEAALVIEAYRNAHGGANPTPALVKQIIKSTATDLGLPADEQGAGLIDALRAVQAAASIHDGNGNPAYQGDAVLTSPGTLSATAAPNTTESFQVQVTNVGAHAQRVFLGVERTGSPTAGSSYTVNLDPKNDPTFVDSFGLTRAYVEQDFTVPAGAQILNAALSFDTTAQPTASPARFTLFDPQGRLAAYTLPQDQGPPFPNSGYGHVDVRFPTAGTWKAFIWTRASASGYSGPVHFAFWTVNNQFFGHTSPSSVLQPGQSGTFTVSAPTPPQPGDQAAKVFVGLVDQTTGAFHVGGAIPVILRSLVPLGANGGSFYGLLTGGNGRFFSPGQTLTYQFDVPAGLKDLDLSLGIQDSNYNLEGLLVGPDGLARDVQSTVTALDPTTGLPTAYTNTLQFFRRDPEPGRWQFVLFINDNSSGAQVALPFLARISFNHVFAYAPGLPNSQSVTLAQGVPVTVPVYVVNTGVTTKDFFLDARNAMTTTLSLGGYQQQVPNALTNPPSPSFLVPPESTELDIAAEGSPAIPLNMDVFPNTGAPPYGLTNAPDIYATPFVDGSGGQGALATLNAAEVPFGPWGAAPSQIGPYPSAATPITVTVGAQVITQQFDPAVTSSTGDAWAILTGLSGGLYTPATLSPGALGKLSVTITPDAAPGTVVHGFIYVDTLAMSNGYPITGSGDELIAIPYTYTVGGAPAS